MNKYNQSSTENKLNSKLWTIVHSSRVHEKFTGYKLLLSDLNFNDYGYYTLFDLYLQLPKETEYNLKIATLNILNAGQNLAEHPTVSSPLSIFTFVRDIESAYKLLFYLTLDERKELISSLNICFQSDKILHEPAYRNSVLRGSNEGAFLKNQKEIEHIITCPLEISTAIAEYIV